MTSAAALCARTPSRMAASSSAMTSAPERCEQRGQAAATGSRSLQAPPWEKQLVWFSDMVMVKMPPRSGTSAKTWPVLSRSQSRTSGADVPMANVFWQAVARGAIDESSQVTEAGLPSQAELREGAGRRQRIQHALNPDAVDAVRGGAVQVAIGKSGGVSLHQRVAVERSE